jgi:hypothetical protein
MTVFTHSLSTNNYGPAAIIVDTNPANGTHTTIQSAITAAAANSTIFLRPGTYTEDLAISKNIALVAYPTVDRVGVNNVEIIGKISTGAAIFISLYGLKLTTNGANFCIDNSTNGAGVACNNCYINASANIAINVGGNSGTNVNLVNCTGNIASGKTLFSTANGTLSIENTFIQDVVAPAASTVTGGTNLYIKGCNLNFPISMSNTSVANILNSQFGVIFTPFLNQTALTTADTVSAICQFCEFYSGTASAISVGAGSQVELDQCVVSSSNTNAITGLGTVKYSGVTFSGSSNIINTTTQTQNYVNLGKYKATGQPCFLVNLNTTLTNKTGNGSLYSVLFDTTTFDLASNITLNSSGKTIFTAPVAGKYFFSTSISYNSLTSAMTNTQTRIVTTANNVINSFLNIGAVKDSSNIYTVSYSIILPMSSGDIANIDVLIQNGAGNTAGLLGSGSATPQATFWSGYLVA